MPSVQVRLEDNQGNTIDLTTLLEVPAVGDLIEYNTVIYEITNRTWTPQRRKDHELSVELKRVRPPLAGVRQAFLEQVDPPVHMLTNEAKAPEPYIPPKAPAKAPAKRAPRKTT